MVGILTHIPHTVKRTSLSIHSLFGDVCLDSYELMAFNAVGGAGGRGWGCWRGFATSAQRFPLEENGT